jgi:hypothetical protein
VVNIVVECNIICGGGGGAAVAVAVAAAAVASW